jgi:hypothetical protein
MNTTELEEQLRLLQQELIQVGEIADELKRDQRAEIDALRLEIEVLRQCLMRVHPDMAAQYEELRAEVLRQIDPEALA